MDFAVTIEEDFTPRLYHQKNPLSHPFIHQPIHAIISLYISMMTITCDETFHGSGMHLDPFQIDSAQLDCSKREWKCSPLLIWENRTFTCCVYQRRIH